jgi:hypothetical protein
MNLSVVSKLRNLLIGGHFLNELKITRHLSNFKMIFICKKTVFFISCTVLNYWL